MVNLHFKVRAGLAKKSKPRVFFRRGNLIWCLIFLVTGAVHAGSTDEQPADSGQASSSQPASALQTGALPQKTRDSRPAFTPGFGETPQRVDPSLVERMEQKAAENRERLRKHVVLPRDAMGSQPIDDQSTQEGEVAATGESPAGINSLKQILIVLFLVAAGVLLGRRFIPEFRIGTVFRPRLPLSETGFNAAAVALEQEKLLSEFHREFCVGPSPRDAQPTHLRLDAAPEAAGPFPSAARHIGAIRECVRQARVSSKREEQVKLLRRVYEELQPLRDLISGAELRRGEQLAKAMENLAKQLSEKAGNINSSSLRTVTQGVELLAELIQPGLKAEIFDRSPLRFLIVDDETFSRHALSFTLRRTLTAPDIAEHPQAALELATRNPYDLILLDVEMPGMDGFELCSKIHEQESNRLTPVLFVTSLRDFDSRSKSLASGGRDLISKPFLTFELTVKALTLIAQGRLRRLRP